MTKHCGLSKLFIFLMAALFSLTLAAPQSRADEIAVGNGVLTLCWEGISSPCDFNGDQPNVSFTDVAGKDQVSIHIGGGGDKDLNAPLLVIFGAPVQNLLFPFNSSGNTPFGGATNPQVPGVINSAGLFEDYNPAEAGLWGGLTDPWPPPAAPTPTAPLTSTFPATIGLTPPAVPAVNGTLDYVGSGPNAPVFTGQGQIFGPTNGQLFADFLDIAGVAGGSDSTFPQWAKEMYDTPKFLANNGYLGPNAAGLLPNNSAAAIDAFIANLLGRHTGPQAPCDHDSGDLPASCVTGFYIWIFEVSTSGLDGNGVLHKFGTGDTINIVTDGFPLGTIVSALGIQEGCNISDPTGGCILAPPDSKKAILMAVPAGAEIPEPTSLLLLGTGLLGIGRQWRKRQNQKKAEKQNVV